MSNDAQILEEVLEILEDFQESKHHHYMYDYTWNPYRDMYGIHHEQNHFVIGSPLTLLDS